MSKIPFEILFTLLCSIANGQDFIKAGTLNEILNHTPQGYTLLDSTLGDLNRDAYTDLAVVYGKQNETEEDRPLLLYIGQEDGTLVLAARNDKTVFCAQCGGVFGDPFTGVAIKNGYFTVEHYGGSSWRWTRYVTFKYSVAEGNWFLSRDSSESFHASDPDNVSTIIKTKKDFGSVPFESYQIGDL